MVELGIERLLSSRTDLVAGDRVGLITNPSGVDSRLRSTIDLLAAHDDIDLRRLFGPEHGIRGRAKAGEHVEDGVDEQTGLPVSSLYGETRRPTAEMLSDVDTLVYDMQDVGVRYYTLVYTLAYAIEGAAEHDTRIVVLDRPNPVAPLAPDGNRVPNEHSSFVGNYRLPVIHGLTVGELARYFDGAFGMGADLDVVELGGWSREQWYDETGLPWVPPSPNMPSLETAILYPGTCLFEGTTLSEGRGTARPFKLLGAPWVDAEAWAATLTDLDLAGVGFRPAYFTPRYQKHEGERVEGVQVHLRDRDAVRPLDVGLSLLVSAFRDYPDSEWRTFDDGHFVDRLAGGPALRERVDAMADDEPIADVVDDVRSSWRDDLESFAAERSEYELYD
ncbi:exo-beta-N-acetylmuramidase NamZ family protein [Halosimplex marinum]|uniref:exo-beta-N-acetylmuramidase NamZ family protein n=1 Tax=Halosimplex marinum TaxID=3396620 RepID=UPI003F55B949